MPAQPYPFEAWPKVSREEAALVRRCARRLPLAAPGAAVTALREVLGAGVSARTLPLGFVAPGELHASLADPLVAVVLAAPEGGHVAVELDPRLAACVIDRALGGEAGADVPEPVAPIGDTERGVLAWVAAKAVAACGARAWRAAAVVTSPTALAFAVGDEGAVVWPAEVRLGEDRGVVRAWIGEGVLGARAVEGPIADRLAALPVTLVVEGARGELTAREVGELREGDVVVLDETWLAPGDGDGFAGEARVRVAGARRTRWRGVLESGALRIEGMEVGHEAPTHGGSRMEQKDEGTEDAVEVAGDAPIEVSVELARFTMPLEELSSLRAGEVVTTGAAVGERVTLRAGDRAIGVGELVDVDGEVGVRLLSLGR